MPFKFSANKSVPNVLIQPHFNKFPLRYSQHSLRPLPFGEILCTQSQPLAAPAPLSTRHPITNSPVRRITLRPEDGAPNRPPDPKRPKPQMPFLALNPQQRLKAQMRLQPLMQLIRHRKTPLPPCLPLAKRIWSRSLQGWSLSPPTPAALMPPPSTTWCRHCSASPISPSDGNLAAKTDITARRLMDGEMSGDRYIFPLAA